ncbi:hypothetical protein [Synechococcus sp. PCC 7335]|uniref:hypothetical protein n=1 Tax=Synechococcus sp. (strain ATCC 29403 / PCC 7335) TaxID=91464 RepID=UPI0018DE28E0|nr:hypothetical protein [Synechococcus sp. PCC 7335]
MNTIPALPYDYPLSDSLDHLANDHGYECLPPEDCTTNYFAKFKEATIQML